MTIKDNKGNALLLDLVVGFGIIALLTALSLPYFKSYQQNLKLSAVTKDLVGDLRYAQQMTITEQVVYQIQLISTSSSYEIIKTGEATSTIKTVALPPEVNYYQIDGLTGNKIIFNSYGSVHESGQITLINNNYRLTTVDIRPSGYIQYSQ